MTNDNKSSHSGSSPDIAADSSTNVQNTQTESKPNIKDKFSNLRGGIGEKFKSVDKDKLKQQIMTHQKVEGLEYVDRDPTNIHRDLKVNFKDVIAEPDGVHSFSTVWGTSYKTYSVSKYWCYRILTAVLGIPFALFWGLYFAFLAFLNVWCVVPFVKCFVIQMKFISQVWGLLVNTFLDPFFESIGKIFANIRLHITMNQQNA